MNRYAGEERTLTCLKILSRDMSDANHPSSTKVEGFCIGDPPCSFVNSVMSSHTSEVVWPTFDLEVFLGILYFIKRINLYMRCCLRMCGPLGYCVMVHSVDAWHIEEFPFVE